MKALAVSGWPAGLIKPADWSTRASTPPLLPEPARAVGRPLATLQMMQLSRAFLGEEISVGVLLPRYYVYVS